MAATQGLDVYEVAWPMRRRPATWRRRTWTPRSERSASCGTRSGGPRRSSASVRPALRRGALAELVALAGGGGEVERHEAIRIVEGMRAGAQGAFLKACRRGIRPEEIYAGEDPMDVWHEAAPAGCLAFAELLAAARAAGAGISESDEARVYAIALRERLVFDVARRANEKLEEDW